jgi:phosphoadenosine phosphosulfate reductase
VRDQIIELQAVAEDWSSEQVMGWAFRTFGNRVAISSAFGAEGMVLIDLASRIGKPFRVFTVDTEFLFPETYNLMEKIEGRYGITIERAYPLLAPEVQERLHGPALWTRNPDQCCSLRKVEPLRRKLRGLDAWITSIRREQTRARAAAHKLEWDRKFGLVKINPLANWTSHEVWRYIHDHDVPYNPLHDQSFPSIGCMHCTRAVSAGEGARDGRWPGFAKTECGLHTIETAPASSEVEL